MRKLLFLLALLPVFAYGQATKTSATFDHVRARASLRIGSGASTAATGIANVMPATPGTQLITAAGVYNWFTGTITLAGDVAGPYNNLQIGTGTVGANELASTTVTAGTYGSASLVPVVTVDADGRVTGVTTAAVSGGGWGRFGKQLQTASKCIRPDRYKQGLGRCCLTGKGRLPAEHIQKRDMG